MKKYMITYFPLLKSREAQWTYHFGIWDLASMMFLGMALIRIWIFFGQVKLIEIFFACALFRRCGTATWMVPFLFSDRIDPRLRKICH